MKIVADATTRLAAERAAMVCTPVQIRLALNRLGLRETVEAVVAGAGQDVKDTWEFATAIHRSNALIDALKGAAGLDDAAVDAIFRAAMEVST